MTTPKKKAFAKFKHIHVVRCYNNTGVYYTVINTKLNCKDISGKYIRPHRHYTSEHEAIMIAKHASQCNIPKHYPKHLINDILFLITGLNKNRNEKRRYRGQSE